MYTHRKILTLTRQPPRPQTPSHARTRPRPLPHSLLSARPSPPRAAPPLPLLPLPLHRRGGRGPSPSPPTLDPSPSSPFTRAAHPDPSPPPTTEQIRTLPILLPRRPQICLPLLSSNVAAATAAPRSCAGDLVVLGPGLGLPPPFRTSPSSSGLVCSLLILPIELA